MLTLVSALRPSGHLVIVRLPEGARFTARFVDDPPGEARDMTALVADLLLSGALDASEAAQSGRPAPDEEVAAAVVSYTEPLVPGEVRHPATFSWVHLPTNDGGDFPPDRVLATIARGIGMELTAGVATEAAAGTIPDGVDGVTPTVADPPTPA